LPAVRTTRLSASPASAIPPGQTSAQAGQTTVEFGFER